MRRCVACHQMRDKRELIRVVKSPEGEIFIDPTGKRTAGVPTFARIPPALTEHAAQNHLTGNLKPKFPLKYMSN